MGHTCLVSNMVPILQGLAMGLPPSGSHPCLSSPAACPPHQRTPVVLSHEGLQGIPVSPCNNSNHFPPHVCCPSPLPSLSSLLVIEQGTTVSASSGSQKSSKVSFNQPMVAALGSWEAGGAAQGQFKLYETRVEAEEIALYLLCNHEDLSSIPSSLIKAGL